MKNIIKKTINISLVISLIALPLNVSAKTVKQYEDEAAKYAQELQEKKDKIAKNDAEVAEIKKNIASIESQITDAENQIKTLEAEIEKSNKVGIMAGASTPEESIQKILEKVEKIIEI